MKQWKSWASKENLNETTGWLLMGQPHSHQPSNFPCELANWDGMVKNEDDMSQKWPLSGMIAIVVGPCWHIVESNRLFAIFEFYLISN